LHGSHERSHPQLGTGGQTYDLCLGETSEHCDNRRRGLQARD